jgi:hypothetical protein
MTATQQIENEMTVMKTLTFDVVVTDQGDKFKLQASTKKGESYFESNYGHACCGLTIESYAFGHHFKKMKSANLLIGMN